jgi:lysozyme family protein
MADFNQAFVASPGVRSGYASDPVDGEIYCGIERLFHPAWEGWPIVDALRFAASDENELKSTLEQNRKLMEKVRGFFKQAYWDRFQGDRISDQQVAEELLESAVELGVRRAVIGLQKVLNTLNPGGAFRGRVVEDGRLGPVTLSALESLIEIEGASYLLKAMKILQALHYIDRIKKSYGRDQYARDWLGKLVVARYKARPKPAAPTDLRLED